MTIFSIVFAIILFSVIIFLHELGHFVAAKLSGVQVNEFALFMGPAIFKKQVGDTLYSIRCIPIGGYCAMEGEDGDGDGNNPHSFQNAAWWKRLIILVAGAAMNFLTGVVIFACLYLPMQQMVVPEVSEFMDCCIFNHEDGIQLGDRILEIDGEKIYVNNDISLVLSLNTKPHHDLVVLRDGKRLEFQDLAMGHSHVNEDGQEYLHYGFAFGAAKDATLLDKLAFVWNLSIDNVRNVRLSLQMLFTGKAGVQDLSGPVGIVQIMTETAEQSENLLTAVLNMLSFGGFIAINLAVMNLLPIPALDGGRVVGLLLTTAVEAVTHKKLNPKYEGYLHGIGTILLLALMALIMFKDIFTIFKG
jgi:regulator of sigma E protease